MGSFEETGLEGGIPLSREKSLWGVKSLTFPYHIHNPEKTKSATSETTKCHHTAVNLTVFGNILFIIPFISFIKNCQKIVSKIYMFPSSAGSVCGLACLQNWVHHILKRISQYQQFQTSLYSHITPSHHNLNPSPSFGATQVSEIDTSWTTLRVTKEFWQIPFITPSQAIPNHLTMSSFKFETSQEKKNWKNMELASNLGWVEVSFAAKFFQQRSAAAMTPNQSPNQTPWTVIKIFFEKGIHSTQESGVFICGGWKIKESKNIKCCDLLFQQISECSVSEYNLMLERDRLTDPSKPSWPKFPKYEWSSHLCTHFDA